MHRLHAAIAAVLATLRNVPSRVISVIDMHELQQEELLSMHRHQ
jgi:hypothetical protein